MAINTTSTLPPPVQIYYDSVLLSTDVPNLIHDYCAMKKTLKGKSGGTIRMERFSRLAPALVPLGNTGITPPGSLLKNVFVDAKISFYGDYVKINEQVELTSQSQILNQAVVRLGHSMRETEDILMRNMLATTAAVLFCTGGPNGDTPTNISLSDIQDSVKTLLSNDARYISSSLDASTKFGTAPVANAYFALGHTNLSSEFSNLNGFTRTYQYGAQAAIKQTEWGAVDAVRVFLSSLGSVEKNASGLNADVYNTFICGQEAYANVKLDNYKARTIFHDGRFDGPLELNTTTAWKMNEAPIVTNDAWVLNLKSTLS